MMHTEPRAVVVLDARVKIPRDAPLCRPAAQTAPSTASATTPAAVANTSTSNPTGSDSSASPTDAAAVPRVFATTYSAAQDDGGRGAQLDRHALAAHALIHVIHGSHHQPSRGGSACPETPRNRQLPSDYSRAIAERAEMLAVVAKQRGFPLHLHRVVYAPDCPDSGVVEHGTPPTGNSSNGARRCDDSQTNDAAKTSGGSTTRQAQKAGKEGCINRDSESECEAGVHWSISHASSLEELQSLVTTLTFASAPPEETLHTLPLRAVHFSATADNYTPGWVCEPNRSGSDLCLLSGAYSNVRTPNASVLVDAAAPLAHQLILPRPVVEEKDKRGCVKKTTPQPPVIQRRDLSSRGWIGSTSPGLPSALWSEAGGHAPFDTTDHALILDLPSSYPAARIGTIVEHARVRAFGRDDSIGLAVAVPGSLFTNEMGDAASVPAPFHRGGEQKEDSASESSTASEVQFSRRWLFVSHYRARGAVRLLGASPHPRHAPTAPSPATSSAPDSSSPNSSSTFVIFDTKSWNGAVCAASVARALPALKVASLLPSHYQRYADAASNAEADVISSELHRHVSNLHSLVTLPRHLTTDSCVGGLRATTAPGATPNHNENDDNDADDEEHRVAKSRSGENEEENSSSSPVPLTAASAQESLISTSQWCAFLSEPSIPEPIRQRVLDQLVLFGASELFCNYASLPVRRRDGSMPLPEMPKRYRGQLALEDRSVSRALEMEVDLKHRPRSGAAATRFADPRRGIPDVMNVSLLSLLDTVCCTSTSRTRYESFHCHRDAPLQAQTGRADNDGAQTQQTTQDGYGHVRTSPTAAVRAAVRALHAGMNATVLAHVTIAAAEPLRRLSRRALPRCISESLGQMATPLPAMLCECRKTANEEWEALLAAKRASHPPLITACARFAGPMPKTFVKRGPVISQQQSLSAARQTRGMRRRRCHSTSDLYVRPNPPTTTISDRCEIAHELKAAAPVLPPWAIPGGVGYRETQRIIDTHTAPSAVGVSRPTLPFGAQESFADRGEERNDVRAPKGTPDDSTDELLRRRVAFLTEHAALRQHVAPCTAKHLHRLKNLRCLNPPKGRQLSRIIEMTAFLEGILDFELSPVSATPDLQTHHQKHEAPNTKTKLASKTAAERSSVQANDEVEETSPCLRHSNAFVFTVLSAACARLTVPHALDVATWLHALASPDAGATPVEVAKRPATMKASAFDTPASAPLLDLRRRQALDHEGEETDERLLHDLLRADLEQWRSSAAPHARLSLVAYAGALAGGYNFTRRSSWFSRRLHRPQIPLPEGAARVATHISNGIQQERSIRIGGGELTIAISRGQIPYWNDPSTFFALGAAVMWVHKARLPPPVRWLILDFLAASWESKF